MRLKRSLVQLIESDYTPLKTDKEGKLRGGFGSVASISSSTDNADTNKICNICTPNVFCSNRKCSNPYCSNDNCKDANCKPVPTASPKPTVVSTKSIFGL